MEKNHEILIWDASLDVIIFQNFLAYFTQSLSQKYSSDFSSEQFKYVSLHQKTRYVLEVNYFCNIIICFCILYSIIWQNAEGKTSLNGHGNWSCNYCGKVIEFYFLGTLRRILQYKCTGCPTLKTLSNISIWIQFL